MKAKDIRKGTVLLHNGNPMRVMDFHHHTPGNLRALVQAKLRNLKTGNQTEVKFSSTEELQEAEVFTFDATFLYSDSNGYHFMNSQNYEEVSVSAEMLGERSPFITDGLKVAIVTWENEVIDIQLPKSVVLTVVECDPEIKGGSVTNQMKQAKTDTGLTLGVPPFLKQGEKVEVSTETGEFLGRAN